MEVDEAGPSTSVAKPPPPPPADGAAPMDTGAPASSSSDVHAYVVTAHRPSAVAQAVSAAFTGPDDINLIISKVTRIEIHKLVEGGLQGISDVPIYGRIACMRVVRPSNRRTDVLFILTERHLWFILAWDGAASRLQTLSSGDANEPIGRPIDNNPVAAIDPLHRCMAIHSYSGILRIVAMDPATGSVLKHFSVRPEELSVLDMRFERTGATELPELIVLHEDQATTDRNLRTYRIDVDQDDILEGPWQADGLRVGAGLLVPVDQRFGGGAVVVGETAVRLCNRAGSTLEHTFDPAYFTCWGAVGLDTERFLLCDHKGGLHLLTLKHADGKTISALELRQVGVTTCGSAITYLDSGVCFVGSAMANSQLIQLHAEPVDPQQPTNHVQILQEFTNLGPIVDFDVVDLDQIGQPQLVACCNTGRCGSLRLIRNGIGINEQASIELQGVRGIWSVRSSSASEFEQYLVITFVSATHVLAMNADDELDEAAVPGFATDAMTLFCGSLDHDRMVQVTANEARLLDAGSGALVNTWAAPEPLAKVVSTGGTTIVAVTGKGHLYVLESDGSALAMAAETDLQVEVTCVDVAPWTLPDGGRLAAVGTWASRLLLVSLPQLAVLHDHDLETTVIPRSTMFFDIEEEHALLLGMGDGQLAHWRIGPDCALRDRKVVSIGVKPLSLSSFTMNGAAYAFAATDRPAVVYARSGKLVYSPVDERDVTMLSSFSTAAFPGALALAKESCLMIAQIDAIQKLHIRTVPLGEQPRRIAHQPASSAFGVLTISATHDRAHVKAYSQTTWEEVGAIQLDKDELGNCITSIPHPDEPGSELFVVGTAYVVEAEAEPTKGRLLLLQLAGAPGAAGRELRVLGEAVLAGACYQAKALPNAPGKVAATVNSRLAVFTVHAAVTPGSGPWHAFELDTKKPCQTIALYLDVVGDTILVGDMMMSVVLFRYAAGALEEVAKEYEARWTFSLAAVSDTLTLAADNEHNLVCLRYRDDADTDAVKSDLARVMQLNVADCFNRIRRGGLSMQLPDAEFAECKQFVLGSILGMITLVVLLPEHRYRQLRALQTALAGHVKGIGGLSHDEFRAHRTEHHSEPAMNAIDGDLVELMLDLPKDEVSRVMDKIPEEERTPLPELTKLVEDLQRLH